MTTEVEARDVLVGRLNPAWAGAYPGVELYYENTTQIDLDTVGSRFATASIDFTDSVRQGIDTDPITASYGVLTCRLFVKEGEGVKVALAMIGFLRTLMKYKELSGVTTDCPRVGKKVTKEGWSSTDLIVPFSFWQ